MPTFLLSIRVDAENVAGLQWPADREWCFDLQQSGGSEVKSKVTFSRSEEHEVEGSRGTAHLVMKWSKQDRKPSTINIVSHPRVKASLEESDIGEWTPILAMDCRGVEPIACYIGDGFTVTSAGGAKFTDVDLSEEWVEYDEKAAAPVTINAVECKIETA